ncbi:MAG: adenylosuccinate synthase [Armatimonadetes bacterium]|nr:adenylosuccinate synthase [Armatimonadota bacterium]
MANVIVIGLLWGDEAKGKVVDFLAQEADYVVRYNGGNNAGHTVVVGESVYKFHTVPVGILHEGVTVVIADGVVLDPKVFCGELLALKERGINTNRIKVSGNAHIILPYHNIFDELEESSKGSSKIGTTGMGIGPCYADKMSRIGIRISEFVDPQRFRERLSAVIKRKNDIITKVYGGKPLDAEAVFNEYKAYAEVIAPFVTNTAMLLYNASKNYANIVFEGAHASLLDIDHGTYPYVTSSHCGAGGACIGTGVGPTSIDRVIGVVKAYTTRVGEGPFPTELECATGERIRKNGNEYGTTTGRPRRCGWFDSVAVRYTSALNATSAITLSLLDVLSGFDKVKVCTAYEIDGKRVTDFPQDIEELAKAKPIFEELPGWSEDISEIKEFADLPENTKRYVAKIADLVETPICMVSVGRRRDQTIILDAEMLQM